MRLMLFVALVLIPAAAAGFTATGVGGGGGLLSGAFLPSDTTVIVLGSDCSGAYRSNDFGASWAPWNDALYNSDNTPSFDVEDLIGVELDGWEGFYAATAGGVYRRQEGYAWECVTDPEDYNYQCGNHAEAIPFSCIDWDGDSLFVAGTGRLWWKQDYAESRTYEETFYPACGSDQYTVWMLDLTDGTPSWEADTDTEFGTARDITFAVIDGDTCIAVGTHDGIYIRKSGEWTSIGDSLYEDSLTCWSLHLTQRGTLYAAMGQAAAGCTSGVYRLFDVMTDSVWAWVGDGAVVPDNNMTMRQMGGLNWTHFIFLSVWDGQGSDPDLLWLGARSRKGLFRGIQGYSAESLGHWTNKIYSKTVDDTLRLYYRDANDDPQPLDGGWVGPLAAICTHPILSPSDSTKLAVHMGSRMHVSPDRGDSWTQAYTTETSPGSGFWYSKGYNELAVRELAITSDGRVIESTGDYGLFRSSDGEMTDWEHIDPTLTLPNAETSGLQVLGDRIYVIAGDAGQGATHTQLYRIDTQDTWYCVTIDLAEATSYRFHDFVFVSRDICFIAYQKLDGEASETDTTAEFGVLKGIHDEMAPNPWTWTTWNEGLLAITTPCSSNAIGVDLLYHTSGRIFMVARESMIQFLGQASRVSVPGGIYKLDSATDSSWELEIGGASSEWKDCRCLAQSADGEVVYAGSRGCPTTVTGTVFKCTNPTSDPTTWTPLINTPSTGYGFNFKLPFYANWGDDDSASCYLTDVRALAVDTRDNDVIYVGLARCPSFLDQQGLWKYDPDGFPKKWTHLSKNQPFEGECAGALLTIPEGDDCMLVLGTHGQELYYELQSDDEWLGPDPAPPSGLKLLTVRSKVGGRTEVNFSLERPSTVEMKIYAVTGRLIHRHDAGRQEAGQCSLIWDGRTRHGRRCASGIYFMRLTAGGDQADKKFLLIR